MIGGITGIGAVEYGVAEFDSAKVVAIVIKCSVAEEDDAVVVAITIERGIAVFDPKVIIAIVIKRGVASDMVEGIAVAIKRGIAVDQAGVITIVERDVTVEGIVIDKSAEYCQGLAVYVKNCVVCKIGRANRPS